MSDYFVYSNIPGAGRGWTLAVLAINRRDADDYIRTHHKSAKFSYHVHGISTVKADCGAVTEAARSGLTAALYREDK